MSYVIAAYGITGLTLVLYVVHLYRERSKGRNSVVPSASIRDETNNG